MKYRMRLRWLPLSVVWPAMYRLTVIQLPLYPRLPILGKEIGNFPRNLGIE